MNEENANVSAVEVQSTQEETQEEKMLSQSQVNEIVEKRLKREREKLEKQFSERINALEEAQKLQTMSETEKMQYQAQKEREAFEEERRAFYEEREAFSKQKYHDEIKKQLNENGLPIEMADLLVGYNAETVAQKIDIMKQSFTQSVNQQVETRIKATGQVPVANERQVQLMTLEQIQALSVDEYNANKELVEQSLKALKK